MTPEAKQVVQDILGDTVDSTDRHIAEEIVQRAIDAATAKLREELTKYHSLYPTIEEGPHNN